MDKPLRLMANRFCGCSVWAWPRFLLFLAFAVCFVFPLAKRKSGSGICGSSCFVFVAVWCFNRFACSNGHVSLQMFITVFVPAWMIPPVYHSLRRESIKTASSASPIGVQSVRPTWFEDTTPKDTTPQPKQDPQGQQPQRTG